MTTLNEDIKRTRENDNTFRVTPLISQVSLQNIYTKAKTERRKNGALGVHVCRAKVGKFFSFLCPLQLQ